MNANDDAPSGPPPPDPAHRMTADTDPRTVSRIHRAFGRQRQVRLAGTRGRHDTRIVVALVVVGTVVTYLLSDNSQDLTLDPDFQGLHHTTFHGQDERV